MVLTNLESRSKLLVYIHGRYCFWCKVALYLISVQVSGSGLYPWLAKIGLALMHCHIRNNKFCSPCYAGGISWASGESSS